MQTDKFNIQCSFVWYNTTTNSPYPLLFLSHSNLSFNSNATTSQAKILSVEFKALKPAAAAKWQKLAEKDKDRYLREMESYTPPSEESDSDDGGKKKKKKKVKDPNAPKRNQSSFFLYSNAVRNDVKAGNPDLKFGQIAQAISRQFKALSADERAHWDRKAADDKERYQRDMSIYRGD